MSLEIINIIHVLCKYAYKAYRVSKIVIRVKNDGLMFVILLFVIKLSCQGKFSLHNYMYGATLLHFIDYRSSPE